MIEISKLDMRQKY